VGSIIPETSKLDKVAKERLISAEGLSNEEEKGKGPHAKTNLS